MHVALTGRSGSSDRVSQLLICVCPGDAFLFEQEAGAGEVARDGVSGFLVLEMTTVRGRSPKAFRSSTEAAK